jgi:hypothetical protein
MHTFGFTEKGEGHRLNHFGWLKADMRLKCRTPTLCKINPTLGVKWWSDRARR